jgi:hypothetical protein
MRLFLDESQGDALEMRAALMRVRKNLPQNLMLLSLDERQGDSLEVRAALMRVRKKSPPKNLMRLSLDESQDDALEVRAALVSVRQAQQLNAVLLIHLAGQPRLTHLLQALKKKKLKKTIRLVPVLIIFNQTEALFMTNMV